MPHSSFCSRACGAWALLKTIITITGVRWVWFFPCVYPSPLGRDLPWELEWHLLHSFTCFFQAVLYVVVPEWYVSLLTTAPAFLWFNFSLLVYFSFKQIFNSSFYSHICLLSHGLHCIRYTLWQSNFEHNSVLIHLQCYFLPFSCNISTTDSLILFSTSWLMASHTQVTLHSLSGTPFLTDSSCFSLLESLSRN